MISAALSQITIPANVNIIEGDAFGECGNLTGRVYFCGNAPQEVDDAFEGDGPMTAYYLPGRMGWGTTFGVEGLPTALWRQAKPTILNFEPDFGAQPGGFGFDISWATNASVVVEAATNLGSSVWVPLVTNAMVNGTNYFTDPQWESYPRRFYRVRPF